MKERGDLNLIGNPSHFSILDLFWRPILDSMIETFHVFFLRAVTTPTYDLWLLCKYKHFASTYGSLSKNRVCVKRVQGTFVTISYQDLRSQRSALALESHRRLPRP